MAGLFSGLLGPVGGQSQGLFGMDPRTAGLVSAAQALGQASAPSRVPQGTGAMMANALAAGAGGYRQAQAAGFQRQMNKIKLQSQLVAMTQPTTEVKESNGRFVEITTQPQYTLVNGSLARNPDGGKISIGEGLNVGDPFRTRTGLYNSIYKLSPKIQDGTATEAERREYAIAATALGKERLTTIPTPSGVQTIRDPGFNPVAIGLPPAVPDGRTATAAGGNQSGSDVVGGRLSEGAAKAWLQHDSIKGTWNKFVQDMHTIGPSINPLGADRKKMASSYRAVFFALKDLAGLGVLSKSDEGLVERWLQDPTSWAAQWGRVNKEYMMADINNISKMVERATRSMEKIYGAQPTGANKPGPILPQGIPDGSVPWVVNGVAQQTSDGRTIWAAPNGEQWIE